MYEAVELCTSIKEAVMKQQPRVKNIAVEFTIATTNSTDQLAEQVLTQNPIEAPKEKSSVVL